MKYSRQREAILQFLRSRNDHPTAEMIYGGIQEQCPKISLGTVYRNLAQLTDLHMIRSLAAGDGKERYDWNTDPHSHFICRICGSVTDVSQDCSDAMRRKAERETGGTVEDTQVYFYGTCGSCAAAENPAGQDNTARQC